MIDARDDLPNEGDDEMWAALDRQFDGSGTPSDAVPESWELAAAALAAELAAERAEPLPAALRNRVLQAAGAKPRVASSSAWPTAALVGWTVAALLLIGVLVVPRDSAVRSPAERRAAFLAQNAQALKIAWAKSEHPDARSAAGDVVFSVADQQGFMRFAGLRPNDPKKEQYQLWVFDAERDDRYPVDGGVFDIPAGSAEVVVPIRTAVRVGKPALFAVTREKPGGVVVSDRSQLVILAKL